MRQRRGSGEAQRMENEKKENKKRKKVRESKGWRAKSRHTVTPLRKLTWKGVVKL